jgi:(S)-citramalyl-CoA lyase
VTDCSHLRSLLFTPATNYDRFEKAKSAGADAVIIDLEDAVSADNKDKAREGVVSYFSQKFSDQFTRALRINSVRTYWGLKDLQAIVDAQIAPDLLFLPKVDSPEDLIIVAGLLSAASFREMKFVAMIESAKGLEAAGQIAKTCPEKLFGLMFGGGDFTAELGAALEWEPTLYARSRLVASAAGGRVAAIDVPYANLHDDEGLTPELQGVKNLGFSAKAAIHPKHIAAINTAFTPTDDEISNAYDVLAVIQKGAGAAGGQMVDEAAARKARRIIAIADSIKR